jgi:hypothetical protein
LDRDECRLVRRARQEMGSTNSKTILPKRRIT